eukprot:2140568-Prymnesium_polylepis.1
MPFIHNAYILVRVCLHPGEGNNIPDVLLALASGVPVSAEHLLAGKRAYHATVAPELAAGRPPPTVSVHFGMDGVDVNAMAWKSHAPCADLKLRILECKVGVADCHVLGPSISRQFRTLSRVGKEGLPPLVLLSPHLAHTFPPLL